ncbi:MAG: AAA family ATPase [Chloroflexi bacterium]|nr:AAA family ATPase [Chloroflexota bacterium]
MILKNNFQLDDIAEIAAKLIAPDPGNELALIIVVGGPGVGKSTLAREFAKQTNSIHFEIDEIKREVVPEEIAAKNIDPQEYRYKYYAEAIRRLPQFFAQSPSHMVIIDETLHLQIFRQMWQEAAKELNIRVYWINAKCDDETVKQRLLHGKSREGHILGDKTLSMYLQFGKAYDSLEVPHEDVDTSQDIAPQVQRIIKKLGIG